MEYCSSLEYVSEQEILQREMIAISLVKQNDAFV